MVIDKRLDILVWSAALLLLLLLGARAWAVETAGAKHYRTLARVRVLTGAVWVSLAVLLGLLGMQGGMALVQAIASGTEPEDFVTVVGPQGDVENEPDPPADPAVPAPDPNAPGPEPGLPDTAPDDPGGVPGGAGADTDPEVPGTDPDGLGADPGVPDDGPEPPDAADPELPGGGAAEAPVAPAG